MIKLSNYFYKCDKKKKKIRGERPCVVTGIACDLTCFSVSFFKRSDLRDYSGGGGGYDGGRRRLTHRHTNKITETGEVGEGREGVNLVLTSVTFF